MLRSVLQALAIAAIAFLAYLPAMRNSYVWDDEVFLLANPLIHAADGLRRFWLTTQASDYFPLSSSVLWAEWRLWGKCATGYHVVNVLLHAANAVLFWRVLLRLRVPGAWLGGLLMAVHPVAAASAAWITEIKNTLSMLLYLLCALAWLRHDERGGAGWYFLSLVLFLSALLAKSSVVTLPLVFLAYAWWRRGEIRRRDLLKSLPFFALSLALGLATIWFQYHHALGEDDVSSVGFAPRLAVAGGMVWYYAYKVLLPLRLCVIYTPWHVSEADLLAFAPLALLAASLFCLWVLRRRIGRGPLFAASCFVISLLPVLGLIEMSYLRFSFTADHLQYIPMIALLGLEAAILARFIGARGWAGQLGIAVAATLVLALAVLTWQRASLYGDEMRLWEANLRLAPNHPTVLNNLGVVCAQRKRFDEALGYYSRAITANPGYAGAFCNRGTAYGQERRYAEALDDLDRAIALRPHYAKALHNRGVVYAMAGRFREALRDFDAAVSIKPEYAAAIYSRMMAHHVLHDDRAALADLQRWQALGGRPDAALLQTLASSTGESN